jgi:hypothetical protein
MEVQVRVGITSLEATTPRAYFTRLFCGHGERVAFNMDRYIATQMLHCDHADNKLLYDRNDVVREVIDTVLDRTMFFVAAREAVAAAARKRKRKHAYLAPIMLTPQVLLQIPRVLRLYPPAGSSPDYRNAVDEVQHRLFNRTPTRVDRFMRDCIVTFTNLWTPAPFLNRMAAKHDMPTPRIHELAASVYGVKHVNHPNAWGHYFPYFEVGFINDTLVLRSSAEFHVNVKIESGA